MNKIDPRANVIPELEITSRILLRMESEAESLLHQLRGRRLETDSLIHDLIHEMRESKKRRFRWF